MCVTLQPFKVVNERLRGVCVCVFEFIALRVSDQYLVGMCMMCIACGMCMALWHVACVYLSNSWPSE